ncbi:MAG TPA: hypothetical protein VFL59_07180 [Candidatus Nanopelagicales bacterium]|nr:hypothetical protein [Candidatus Nanopelagicales bacterium]
MSPTPTFRWTPTPKDYEAALRLWRDGSGASARTRMIGATLLALGFITTYFALTLVQPAWLALIPFFGIIGVGLVWFRDLPARIGLRQVVSSTPEMLQPLTIVVDKDGLTASNPTGTETFPWASFAACIESDSMMLLGLSLDSPAAIGILKREAAVDGPSWDAATARVRSVVPAHPRIAHLRDKKAR